MDNTSEEKRSARRKLIYKVIDEECLKLTDVKTVEQWLNTIAGSLAQASLDLANELPEVAESKVQHELRRIAAFAVRAMDQHGVELPES